MNEMTALREFRDEVPAPSDEQLRAVEARVMAGLRPARATRPPRRVTVRRLAWRAGLAAGLAAAVAVGVVTMRGTPAPQSRPPSGGPAASGTSGTSGGTGTGTGTGSQVRPVSAAQVLDLAAQAAQRDTEINPQPGQFIVYQSITMYEADLGDLGRYLYRTTRTIWLSADGTRAGVLRVEHLQPQAYPGWPIPPEAAHEVGRVELLPLCPNGRQNYQHNRTLPTDPQRMLAYLGSVAGGGGDHHYRLWEAAGDLLRENYLPPAQRAALYQAIKLIPGVELVAQAQDAAGRTGVGVGFVDTQRGERDELIFAPDTFRYLGERAFVVDAAKAQAPVGSQLAGTAELSVTVADSAPAAPAGPKDLGCK